MFSVFHAYRASHWALCCHPHSRAKNHPVISCKEWGNDKDSTARFLLRRDVGSGDAAIHQKIRPGDVGRFV